MSNTIKALAVTTLITSALMTGCASNPMDGTAGKSTMTNAINGIMNGQSPADVAKEAARKSAVDSINGTK